MNVDFRNSFRYVGEGLASMLSRLGARSLAGSFPAYFPSHKMLDVAHGAVRNAGMRAETFSK